MVLIIALMLSGILVGYLFKKKKITWISRVITLLIWVLLFLLGIDVGSNQAIMSGLHTIGLEALVITVGAVLGSVVGARLLWKWINKDLKEEARQ
ncbi:MAG TPA: lysine exporter LysO family protein [Petrimonas sp.]|uniref:LysO family transporter n=1 Tax=Petrimonas sp. TaxID=2023866 RepID=UPI001754D158|nr:LysO family transporter [Petrimonas sp.]HHV85675.1 lysine exporter LysO family protein [Petrimonas sp.]